MTLNLPVAGSYNSAEARAPEPESPPAMSTRPPGKRVPVPNRRGVIIGPVGVNVPVAGSYKSADVASAEMASYFAHPATRTLPSGSRMATGSVRMALIVPVLAKVPVAGSYSSAEARPTWSSVPPPMTRTRPSGNRVATC